MTIALSLLLLIASGAAFWSVATYAQRHWPTQLQYVATWIVSSIIAAAVWALASLGYDLIASTVHYCGFQDAAPCSRWDFLQEQLGIWTIVTFVMLVPAAAILAGIIFFVRAALGSVGRVAKGKIEQRSSRASKFQISLCAIITTLMIILPPVQIGPTVVKVVIVVALSVGAWFLAGRLIAKGATLNERNNAWLWYSFASTLICSIVSAIYVQLQAFQSCEGVIGDPDCHSRTAQFALKTLPFSVIFSVLLYLIPVLALVRLAMLARACRVKPRRSI